MLAIILIKYKQFANSSFLYVDETLTGMTSPDQNGPGSNGNKRVLYTLQSSTSGASTLDVVSCYTQWVSLPFLAGVLPLCVKYIQCILNPAERVQVSLSQWP